MYVFCDSQESNFGREMREGNRKVSWQHRTSDMLRSVGSAAGQNCSSRCAPIWLPSRALPRVLYSQGVKVNVVHRNVSTCNSLEKAGLEMLGFVCV